jgi:sigma-B regulation protein RsbU (phosphoserine phosphatase)
MNTLALHDKESMIRMERELNLKQLQIKSLLAITQAINENVSADGLYGMYKTFLTWDMGVKKMALYVKNEHGWTCATHQNLSNSLLNEDLVPLFTCFDRLHTVQKEDHRLLRKFDIVIPVYHKKVPIAYALLDGIREREDAYNKIEFITTYTNIIAVALENKRLFKRQVEQETLRREMELASKVQRMLIPEALPQGTGYELDALYRPHFNIGGDYFDVIQYDKDRIVLCIADISGKGIAAALLMANFQANLQSLIYQYKDLQAFIIAINESVFRITRGDKFITLFIAELNLKTKKLSYINAGHYPPFLRNGDQVVRLDRGCTVIGAFEDIKDVDMGENKIEGEGLILTFTDGLTDIRNAQGKFFEEEEIERVIRSFNGKSAKTFNQFLLQNMEQFKGELAYPDDIAVLSCWYSANDQ